MLDEEIKCREKKRSDRAAIDASHTRHRQQLAIFTTIVDAKANEEANSHTPHGSGKKRSLHALKTLHFIIEFTMLTPKHSP